MRIRKILPLALLAIGSLFMLTSCDRLLDFIFSSNTINVNVQAYDLKYVGYVTGGTITVVVTGSSGTTYQAGPSTYEYLDAYYNANYNFSFGRLPNDTYTIYTYYTGAIFGGGATSTYYFYDPLLLLSTAITLPYSGGGSTNLANVIVVMP